MHELHIASIDASIFLWTPRYCGAAESSFRICVDILKTSPVTKSPETLVVDDLRSSDRSATDTTFNIRSRHHPGLVSSVPSLRSAGSMYMI
jgi:hypothetical protein